MVEDIIIFVPYFGVLPDYFLAFAHSCKYIKCVRFMVFTDDNRIKSMLLPKNISYELMSFSTLQRMIRDRELGRVTYAYKLCDYKPLYGIIFDKYTDGYSYWGYCDIDTMMGDVDTFLQKIDYKKYDRIGEKGHFTLYRNDERINQLYRTKLKDIPPIFDFDFVKSTSYLCHFDESGMNWIVKEMGIPFYENSHVAQTTIVHDFHLHTFMHFKQPELFVWERGHVYIYRLNNGSLEKSEYMYIHFQDRKQMPIHEELDDMILVTHKGFYSFDLSQLNEYFMEYGRVDTDKERALYIQQQKERIKKGQYLRMKRELCDYGIKAFPNIYARAKSVRWLKKHNLF